MKGGWGSFGGKGKGKGWKGDWWGGNGNWGAPAGPKFPGLDEALNEAFTPVSVEDPTIDLGDTVKKVVNKIWKVATKFMQDERLQAKGTSLAAQALIEDFVDELMTAIRSPFWDSPWISTLELGPVLLICVSTVFADAKVFNRTLSPKIESFVQEAQAKFNEVERVEKAMWEAIETCGVQESSQKTANKNLKTAFEDAHFKSPWGTHQGETPALGFVMDFVKGFMSNFVASSSGILKTGLNGSGTPDEQVLFLTMMFQNLLDPMVACIPHELQQAIEAMPPAPWPFVGECAMAVMSEGKGGGKGNKGKRKWGGKW